MPLTLTVTITTRAGYVRTIDVDAEFIEIVGRLSRDKEIRDLAAFGSSELSVRD